MEERDEGARSVEGGKKLKCSRRDKGMGGTRKRAPEGERGEGSGRVGGGRSDQE